MSNIFFSTSKIIIFNSKMETFTFSLFSFDQTTRPDNCSFKKKKKKLSIQNLSFFYFPS